MVYLLQKVEQEFYYYQIPNSKNLLLVLIHGLMPSGCIIKFLKPTALGKSNTGQNLLDT